MSLPFTWIGRCETDPARDSSRLARGSCGRDRLGSYLPRDALITLAGSGARLSQSAPVVTVLRFLTSSYESRIFP